tara:strand:- start:5 stop:565 length:561 start_codon:yes stop_codon:yes gene_type:complete
MKQLIDYIKVYENILSKSECDFILNEYKETDEWTDSTVKSLNNNIRKCQSIGISLDIVINNNQIVRKNIDQFLFQKVGNIATKYTNTFQHSKSGVLSDTGYDLLRYTEGGFYKIHTDSCTENPREFSMSIILNDDYEGGELAFFEKEYIIKPTTGSVVVFPANFMYPHEVITVKNGVRYAIVTWFV